ncbi:ATP-binding protein, partial [Desulfobacterales bacterium HSG17]|nr:ATP-binding protein [Desulfobacterales bacterium HSG17]
LPDILFFFCDFNASSLFTIFICFILSFFIKQPGTYAHIEPWNINVEPTCMSVLQITYTRKLNFSSKGSCPLFLIHLKRLPDFPKNSHSNNKGHPQHKPGHAGQNSSTHPGGTYSDNESVTMELEDTGNGISPQELDTLFVLGKSLKKSSGFGLYYCKKFVEDNGGTMTLESPGTGCGATVLLRFNQPNEES